MSTCPFCKSTLNTGATVCHSCGASHSYFDGKTKNDVLQWIFGCLMVFGIGFLCFVSPLAKINGSVEPGLLIIVGSIFMFFSGSIGAAHILMLMIGTRWRR